MTILFLDQFGEIGGAQRSLLDLLPAILHGGWQASAMVPAEGPLAAAIRARNATVQPIRCGPYGCGRKSPGDMLRFARDFPRLARAIAHCPADVIYVNGPRLLPAAAWAARGRPLVFHCHSPVAQRWVASLLRASLRLARAELIASSRFAAQRLSRTAHVVYNGVAPQPPRERGWPPRDGWRIGVIGRLAPQKGQAEFLQAAREIPNCRFVLCGAPLFSPPSYLERLHILAAGLPVDFLGWREDVGAVLAGLDLLVAPSTGPESTTRVILEAFSSGVPVVAFPTGGIPEVIDHGRTGFLVEPHVLAKALRDLIAGPPGRLEAVARAARQEWSERFTLAAYRQRIVQVIERAAGAAAARPQPLPEPRPRPAPPGTRTA